MSKKISRRQNKIRRWVAGVSLLLLMWCLLAYFGARLLIVSAPLERADAIVILSGSDAFAERARFAAQLYKDGIAAKIILTNDNRQGGWSSAEERNPFFYERSLAELRQAGVPAAALEVIPQPVTSTYEEAVLLRGYSKSTPLNSLLIVTSAYHSRRALRTFRRAFEGQPTELGLRAVAPGIQTPQPASWWLHIRGWKVVALEYLKLVYYEVGRPATACCHT